MAIAAVLRHEGDRFVDDPTTGECSKRGVELRWYRMYVDPAATKETIRNLTPEQATSFYRDNYWTRNKFFLIKDPWIAAKLFDLGVNVGPGTAVKLAQKVLNIIGDHNLTEDGILGPRTASALENTKPLKFLIRFVQDMDSYYHLVASRDPNKAKFLDGWMNRLYDSC